MSQALMTGEKEEAEFPDAPIPIAPDMESLPGEIPPPSATPDASGKARVGRNIAATAATQLVSWALTFVLTIYLPRYIGPEGNGKFGQATSFVMLFSVLVPFGTSQVLVKEIARNRTRLGELLVMALCLRLPLALGLGGLAALTGSLLFPSATLIVILVNIAALPIFAVNDVFTAALQGQEKLPRQGLIAIAERTLFTGLVLWLIHVKTDLTTGLWLFAAAAPTAALLQLSVHLWNYRGVWKGTRLPQWGDLRWLALAGFPFLGWSVFQAIYGLTDPLVLGWVVRAMTQDVLLSDTVAGWYVTAFKLIGTTLFFPLAISTALLPTLARLHTEGETERFQRLARKALEIVMLIGVPLAVLFAVSAGSIIPMLFGPKFYGAIPVLRVSSLSCLMYFAGCVLGTLVNAIDQQRQMLRVTIIAALISVPRCIIMSWLAQKYMGNGAIGAMFSGAILEIFLVRSYLKILPKGLFDKSVIGKIVRYALASLPMAALLYLISARGWSLFLVALCPLIYGVGLIVLRAIDRSDWITFRDIFRRRAA